MRAIVVVSGIPDDVTLAEQYTTPLLPLVDRPFLQHVVEYLVEGGITTFDFVVSHLPEKVELLLGDGTRWGSTFRFHLAADDSRLYTPLRRLASGDAPVLLVHADRLPQADIRSLSADAAASPSPVLLVEESGEWTGWAMLTPTAMATIPALADEAALKSWLSGLEGIRTVSVAACLQIQSFAGLLAAQAKVAQLAFPSLLKTGRPVAELAGQRDSDQVRLCRGSTVHPTARLIAPVFIGENSRIGAGATIGPNVVIGANVLVGEQTTVREALLLPGTYVGDGLELTESVVEHGRIWSVRHGDAVSVPDAFLLGDLTADQTTAWATEAQSRFFAAILLFCLWPVLAFTALGLLLLRRSPLLYRHTFVVLPTTLDSRDWKTQTYTTFHPSPAQLQGASHFLLHVLPGLPAVCSGKIQLVGVPSRTAEEVAALPQDFRAIYVRSKAGLIVDRPVQQPDISTEDQYTAEAFYAATASARKDMTVLANYLQGNRTKVYGQN